MTRLEEIKNEYAESKGWDNWSDFISCIQITRREDHYDEISVLYAKEVAQASLEKASEKITLIENEISYVKQSDINTKENIVLL